MSAASLYGLLCLLGMARAQNTDAPGPVGGVPAALPEIRLPELRELSVAVPRQVRAAQAVLGMGRPRLALVVGVGTVGSRAVVDSAARDTQAVASALRSGGFVVMLREDVSSAELRSSLKEFRERLQPEAVGFVYVTGLGAQVDGKNLLLGREAALDAAAPAATLAARLQAASVPLDEVADALIGPPDSPRLLVVDAAYQHPALAALPQPGLAEPRLPHGQMALFGHALGSWQEVLAVAPLPIPAPTDARALAASPFAHALVGQLLKARVNGPDALRGTRRALVDGTLGRVSPWIGGDTDEREELAEATLLDGLIPRTPEEIAREAARQAARLITRQGAGGVGEQAVAEVLQAPGTATTTAPTAPSQGTPPATPPDTARPLPEAPGPSSLGSVVSGTASAVGTVASVAATAAVVATAARAAEASAAVSVASTAVGTAGSLAANAVAVASRLSAGSGEAPAREVVRQAAAAATTGPATTAAAGTAASPAASPAATAAVAPVAAAPGVATSAAPAAAPAVPAAAADATNAATNAAATTATNATDPTRQLAEAGASALADQAGSGGNRANQAASQAPNQRLPQATDGRTARTAEGGERPVYAPRTNNFGYAEGDTYTYQVRDMWKDEVTTEFTTAIEEVLGNGQLLANGQQLAMDAQGRITKIVNGDGTVSSFEPSQDIWWSKPARGQSRDVLFKETVQRGGQLRGQTEWKGSSSVGRLQKIDTPAGEFEVMPIETSGWWTEVLPSGVRNSGQFSRVVWYSVKLGHPVAIDIEDADRLGKLLKRERVELLHAQSARNAP